MEMAVFPIIKALYYSERHEVHKIVGTGFFFDSTGLFLSARHVFEGRGSALDLEDAKGFAIYCVHTVNLQRKAVARHIDVASIKTRTDTDIASGFVEINQFGRGDDSVAAGDLKQTAFFRYATTASIQPGTKIWTVAYPLATIDQPQPGQVNVRAKSDFFFGSVTKHYPERRDRGMLSWPCYETDMEIKPGASGGPVFIAGSAGVVFGINCTDTEPHHVSHVTSLAPLVSHR